MEEYDMMRPFRHTPSPSQFPNFRPLEAPKESAADMLHDAMQSQHSSPPLTVSRGPSPVQSRDVVPFSKASATASSQDDRIARARAGDLNARLELIPIASAEATLAHRYCRHDPSRSILSYLREPSEGVAPHQAASAILEDFADKTEDTALDTLLVFRLIQAHELWKTHPDPEVQSAEDFIRALKQKDFVQALLVMGASVESGKRTRIAIIESAWGSKWFDQVPESIRDPRWGCAEQCSRGLLTEIAATAEQGMSLEAAVRLWQAAICDRNDVGRRRELKIRAQTGPYLIPSDAATLSTQPPSSRQSRAGRRHRRETDDTLKVEVVPPRQIQATPSRSGSFSRSIEPAQKRKRRHPILEDSEDETVTGDAGWTVSDDGKSMRKRVGNQIMYKSVEKITDSDEEALSQVVDEMSSQDSQHPPTVASTAKRSCDGASAALILRKFHRAFEDARLIAAHGKRTNGFCDCCRPFIQEALEHFDAKLLPCAAKLEAVRAHTFDEDEVPPTQDHGISPLQAKDRFAVSRTSTS